MIEIRDSCNSRIASASAPEVVTASGAPASKMACRNAASPSTPRIKLPEVHKYATTSGSTPSTSRVAARSEEHTSELQSRGHLVCRLLLEKKKKTNIVRMHAELHVLD